MSSGKKEACATSIYPEKCSMDCVCHGSELPNDNLVNCVHFFKEYTNNQLDEVELRQKVHLSIFFGQPCFMVCTTALRGQMWKWKRKWPPLFLFPRCLLLSTASLDQMSSFAAAAAKIWCGSDWDGFGMAWNRLPLRFLILWRKERDIRFQGLFSGIIRGHTQTGQFGKNKNNKYNVLSDSTSWLK